MSNEWREDAIPTTEEVKQAPLITSLIFFVLDIEEVEVNDGDFK